MPISDFHCLDCGEKFEALVLEDRAHIPGCQGARLEQQISSFAVSSEAIRESNLGVARAQACQSSSRLYDGHAQRREKPSPLSPAEPLFASPSAAPRTRSSIVR